MLFVDDEADARELLEMGLRQRGFIVETAESAEQALQRVTECEFDVVLTDVRLGSMDGIALCAELSRRPEPLALVVVTAFGQMDVAIGAIRAGADDFVTKPFKLGELELVLDRAIADRRLRAEVKNLSAIVADASREWEILGESPQIRAIYDVVEQIAASQTTVLITGESGTGKELVARAIHDRSPRTGEFVAINCAAMPASLLESELFGHVKGAFTDARTTRQGLFCKADGGTIFLDEIGEMPIEMQVKLLRVLQERRVRPVGSDHEQSFDTRVIAATNRDLKAAVNSGQFREDLFYRINIVPIGVPPLRDRGEDVLLLAQAFVERTARKLQKRVVGISPAAATKLLEYAWPGNVRELENCMERAVALTRYRDIMVEDLPDRIRYRDRNESLLPTPSRDEPMPTLEEAERRYVIRVLRTVKGNKTKAARILGLDRRTLYRRLRRLGIEEEPGVAATDDGEGAMQPLPDRAQGGRERGEARRSELDTSRDDDRDERDSDWLST